MPNNDLDMEKLLNTFRIGLCLILIPLESLIKLICFIIIVLASIIYVLGYPILKHIHINKYVNIFIKYGATFKYGYRLTGKVYELWK